MIHTLTVKRLAAAALMVLALSAPAAAQDVMCDPGEIDCRFILRNHISTERGGISGIDVAFWFMEDARYTADLIRAWQAGVPVRVIVDTRANASYPANLNRIAELRNAGIPMRERFTGGILHWKMMLFHGQDVVEFSGANFSADAWVPTGDAFTNYIDESILFSHTPSVVNSFRTKFDDLWTNTSAYRDYANMPATRARAYDTFPKDPELNFPPSESYANRAVGRYNKEVQQIDVIMYRITDQRHTNAMINAKSRGVRVRLITEPKQYRDATRLWHSWNVDRLYMAGVEIKHRVHAGLNHQKSVILHKLGMTIFGSSNWTSASAQSQEEHNLFTTDQVKFQWFVDQFERKWENSAGVVENGPFTPLPPDAPKTPSPANLATAVSASTLPRLRWYGGPWAHRYDVYFGTDSNNMALLAENLALGPSESASQMQQYQLTSVSLPGGILLPGTTYYWRVVGRTMADMERSSSPWRFTTDGVTPPPPTATIVREPYLQQVSATSAVIVWATRESGSAQVRFSAAGATTVTTGAASTLYPASSTGMPDYYQHVASLSGLTPSTTYNYDVFVAGIDVNPVVDTLRTAPAKGTGSVAFVAFGDSGTGSDAQRQIASLIENESFDLALHAGDVAYGLTNGTGDGSHSTLDSWFFSTYRNWLRARPVFPSMGNHDSRAANSNGQAYLDMFVLPTNGASSTYPDHAERYYSFDYGPMHVAVLDTEFAFQGPDTSRRAAQLAWLEADLAATSQPWKVALFHRSPYSSGGEHGSDAEVRAAFAPVFERHGVQLAISAHEHDYERSVPLRADVPDPAGVTYLVTGGGGAPLYLSGTSTWTAASASRHHYVRASVTECTLRLDAVGLDGLVFDTFSTARCAPVDTAPPVVAITAPGAGASVRGVTIVSVSATDNVGVANTELLVDGESVGSDPAAPFGFNWDSTTVDNGPHTLAATATDAAGNTSTSATVTVPVSNPTVGTGDIVLYAADVPPTSIVGNKWKREDDVTAAGGARLRNPNANAAKRTTALANPADYFDMTFSAPANVLYHLWVRGKADADSYANDSVFVQFSDTTANLIGTTSAAEVNLEDCSGCRISGWGWQDNGWGVGVMGPPITFTSPGTHTIRIQSREDGLSIDQIMLSPAQFFTASPGALRNDATIYPRAAGGPPPTPDTENPAASITTPTDGAPLTGVAAVTVQATDNVGVTRVELLVDGAPVATSSSTSTPFAVNWDTRTASNGSHVLRALASDAAENVTATAPVNVTVNNPPPADTVDPSATITSPASGATLTGAATVTVGATDNVGVTRVELLVNGTSVGTSPSVSTPYSFSWDTTTVSDGTYTLRAQAFDAAVNVGESPTVSVTVANTAPPQPRTIVLYTADAPATSVHGKWRPEPDSSAAGGARLRHPDASAAKRTTALAAPADYFEMTFTAEANVLYHLWVRSRGDVNYWANDSVFVQFSKVAGAMIGTTGAAEMNLEDCSGCGLAGWGWQDNGWGVGVTGPDIVFTTGGLQTIRIQTREDGLSIDQIVLSPSTYLTTAPGALKNDTTKLPKSP